ncbi:MarR family transcriptional regulator [Oxalobacteraceae bacterium]|nr:MarR family transcriptional regulator [Oxalobacteraceae bacterium]
MKPRLFHLIAQARQNLFRGADRVFTESLDVSGTQVVALFAIKENPGCLLKDLAQVLQLQNSAITGLVTRMEDNGLIVKTPCAADGRASRLSISDAGAGVVASAQPLLKSINAQLLKGFTEQEVDTIARFLRHAIEIDFQRPPSPPSD